MLPLPHRGLESSLCSVSLDSASRVARPSSTARALAMSGLSASPSSSLDAEVDVVVVLDDVRVPARRRRRRRLDGVVSLGRPAPEASTLGPSAPRRRPRRLAAARGLADEVDTELLGRAQQVVVFLAHLGTLALLGSDVMSSASDCISFMQHLERLGDVRLGDVLALDDRLVGLDAPDRVVGLDREHLLEGVGGAVGLQRPHLHLAEALAAELRLAAQRLLGDERVGAGASGRGSCRRRGAGASGCTCSRSVTLLSKRSPLRPLYSHTLPEQRRPAGSLSSILELDRAVRASESSTT